MFSNIKRIKDYTVDQETPVYDELVELLYASTFNIVFIGIAAAFFCGVIATLNGDSAFWLFAVLAVAVSFGRFLNDQLYHRKKATRSSAFWEKSHAVGSLAFAAVVALIGSYTFSSNLPEAQLFASVFLVSYCTGILSRLSVRPRVAARCIMLAALPCVVALVANPSLLHKLLGIFVLMTALASLQLIKTTYRLTLESLLARQELASLAGSDPLTGLANRYSLDHQLRRLFLTGQVGPSNSLAVHFIDLDHFKHANDTFGHAVGDAILVEVARRLNTLMPSGAFAARRGGDEFLVVQPHVSTSAEAKHLAHAIASAVSEPYKVLESRVIIGASVGLAMTDNPDAPAHQIIVAADEALYQAKRAGRGSVHVSGESTTRVA